MKTLYAIRIPNNYLDQSPDEQFKVARIVQLPYEFDQGKHGQVFWLLDGVTGYESFYLDSFLKRVRGQQNWAWCACAGTTGRWDALWIPSHEMKRALAEVL